MATRREELVHNEKADGWFGAEFSLCCSWHVKCEPRTEEKGRDLIAPHQRHREAPIEKARQAAPKTGEVRRLHFRLKIRGFLVDPQPQLHKVIVAVDFTPNRLHGKQIFTPTVGEFAWRRCVGKSGLQDA